VIALGGEQKTTNLTLIRLKAERIVDSSVRSRYGEKQQNQGVEVNFINTGKAVYDSMQSVARNKCVVALDE
jgi:hypothetical protein